MNRRRPDEREREKNGKQDPTSEREPFFSSLFGSVLIHAAILFIAFWVIQSGGKTGNRMGGRHTETVGIVFSDEAGGGNSETEDDGRRAETSDEAAVSSDDEPAETSDAATEQAAAPDLIGVNAPEERPMVTIHSGSGRSGREVGRVIGKGPGDGGGSGQTVGFGELKGRGRRFVYVIDRSESMRWPNDLPIRYALAEAKASVASLDPKKGALKFQLLLYNHDTRVFGDGRLLDVTAANQRAVSLYLDSVRADGGTDPLMALEKAIALKPDVIFFLTDADEEISPMVLARIRESRIRGRVDQIHVMEFGKPDAKRLHSFRRLAEQNNGLYIFKDVTRPEF